MVVTHMPRRIYGRHGVSSRLGTLDRNHQAQQICCVTTRPVPAGRARRKTRPGVAAVPGVFQSDSELAQWLGVNRSQLTRYRRGQRPRGETAWRLLGLETVVEALGQFTEPAAIPDWLLGINAHLNDQRPIDLLRRGQLAQVIAAIEAERAGSFA